MKYSLLLLSAVLLLSGTAVAQKNPKPEKSKRTCVNRFDSTLAKKHEFSFSVGIANAPSAYGVLTGAGMGPSLAVDYARVYRSNHFLRAGIRYFQNEWNGKNDFTLPAKSNPSDPDPSNPQLPGNYSIIATARNFNTLNSHTGLFVGYEYGVGRGKFRFTFGADLVVGYHYQSLSMQEDVYHISRTLDPVTQLNEYNIKYLQTGHVSGTAHRIFLGLSPRIGIRRDFGRRVALALTFTPQIGATQRIAYDESVTDTRPSDYRNAKTTWYTSPNLDLRIIFKLGKS